MNAIGIGMKVIFHGPFITEPKTLELKFFDGQSVKFTLAPSSLDEVLAQSDFISLHVPSQAKPLIGKAEIEKMKPGATSTPPVAAWWTRRHWSNDRKRETVRCGSRSVPNGTDTARCSADEQGDFALPAHRRFDDRCAKQDRHRDCRKRDHRFGSITCGYPQTPMRAQDFEPDSDKK